MPVNVFFSATPAADSARTSSLSTSGTRASATNISISNMKRACSKSSRWARSRFIPGALPLTPSTIPDRVIFDLDPAPEVPFEALKLAAQDIRSRLSRRGLESTLKCTGGKGLHVTVALAGKDKWPEVKAFAAAVAEDMVASVPEAYVATMTKAKRTGKIFIDYFRNDYTATAIADYGVRARPGAPVAVPLEWGELKSLQAANQFSMKDVLKRIKNRKPPPAPKGQRLPT